MSSTVQNPNAEAPAKSSVDADVSTNSDSMAGSVVKGAAWATMANIARIASAIFVLPVLARFLSPDDFGIVQIGMPVVLFLMMFNDFGFGPALVRAKSVSKQAWTSVFWINVAVGATLTAIIYFLSAPVAGWFNQPRAEPILQVLSFTVILNCLTITPAAKLQRQMRFDLLSMVEVFSIGAGIAVAIFSAIQGYGAWSLVFQQVVMFSLKTILMWLLARPPIAPIISVDELREMFGFSSNMMLTRVVNFVSRNADNIIIGRILGAAALGYYSIAYRILLLPVEVFAWGLSQVLMPAMSTFQENKGRMRAATLRTYRLISLCTFPAMAGVSLLAEPLIIVVLGERMAPAAAILQIIAPVGAIQSLGSTQGAMYMALGRADILFRLSLIGMAASVIGFQVGVNWGLEGVATAYLVLCVSLSPFSFIPLMRLIKMSLGDIIGALKTPFLATLLMAGTVLALKFIPVVAELPNLGKLVFLSSVGAVTYVGLCVLLDRKLVKEVLGLISDIKSR